MPYRSQASRSNQLARAEDAARRDGTGVSSSVVDLHADALVVLQAEQVVDDVEALARAAG